MRSYTTDVLSLQLKMMFQITNKSVQGIVIFHNGVVIFSVRGTAQMVGRGVQVVPTTAASPSGSSVTAKTTVVTTATSCPSTVPSATPPPSSSARTTAASPSE